MWSATELRDLEEAFSHHDADSDGRLTPAEHRRLLVYVGQDPDGDAALKQSLTVLDSLRDTAAEGEGVVFAEFLDVLTQRAEQDTAALAALGGGGSRLSPREALLAAFRVFDRENKGYIPDAELRNVLRFLGDKLTAQEAEELIYLSPGVGRIEYHKFVDMLLGEDAGAEDSQDPPGDTAS